MTSKHTVSRSTLQKNGSLFIDILDDAGRLVAVTRISVLHIGEKSRDVIEVRTETKNGNTEQRVEVTQ